MPCPSHHQIERDRADGVISTLTVDFLAVNMTQDLCGLAQPG